MNPHVRHAVWAAAFTGLLFVVFVSGVHTHGVVPALIMPGWLLAAMLRLRGGVDGGPDIRYAFPFTFLIYWLLFEIGYTVWRGLIRTWITDRD